MGNTLNEQDDNEIIKQILQGNVDDFEVILKRYDSYVFSIVAKHVPYDRVEEVAHDVFINTYKSLPTYKAETPFKNWISKIAVRRCYDFWREHYRLREIPMTSLSEEHCKWFDTVVSDQSHESFQREESRKELREILEWALSKLTPEDRMVVTLLHLEGLSVREVAELLGWSVVNVKVRAHRSRSRLHKYLSTLYSDKRDKNDA